MSLAADLVNQAKDAGSRSRRIQQVLAWVDLPGYGHFPRWPDHSVSVGLVMAMVCSLGVLKV